MGCGQSALETARVRHKWALCRSGAALSVLQDLEDRAEQYPDGAVPKRLQQRIDKARAQYEAIGHELDETRAARGAQPS